MKVNKNFYVPDVQTGDLIEIDCELFLVCPHPTENFKYYMPCLNGHGLYGKNGWTLQEIEVEVRDRQANVYSKDKYELMLEEIRQ